MKITSGKIQKFQKVVVYGPEGIGKSTFASQFPRPLFIDTEGSTAHLDVARLDRPSSWPIMMQYIDELKKDNQGYKTLVIDTIDWAEHLIVDHICNKNQVDGIESFGYGKGYVYEKEEFGRMLNHLQDLVDTNMNVVITAHAMVRKFERPDQPPYDRYELKLNKAGAQKISDMVKEWADMLLFANYKEEVYKVESKAGNSKKVKVVGGQRVMYTFHHPNWDAKNRHGLKECLPFEFSQIENCIPTSIGDQKTTVIPTKSAKKPVKEDVPPELHHDNTAKKEKTATGKAPKVSPGIPKKLVDLMNMNKVTEADIQAAVGRRGYFPADMPISNYPKDFVDGVLIAAFDQILKVINDSKDSIPF